MGADSRIEWCQHTFNPFVGCTKVSPACDHCYAESWAKRSGAVTWGGERKRTSVRNWNLPLKWDRHAAESGTRPRVFCASLADWLDNEVPIEWFVDLLDLIRCTPNLDWLLLSKRIVNWRKRLSAAKQVIDFDVNRDLWLWVKAWLDSEAPLNVWIGATVCNQTEADRDVPKLLQVPARVRFLSVEPMLGPVDLPGLFYYGTQSSGGIVPLRTKGYPQIDWVICGGESGPKARPMHPEWVRSLRDQCQEAGVPFLFKQWGGFAPYDRGATDSTLLERPNALDAPMIRVGKKAAGRLLDGKLHDEYPLISMEARR